MCIRDRDSEQPQANLPAAPAARFTRLAAVDEQYISYTPPVYERGMTCLLYTSRCV